MGSCGSRDGKCERINQDLKTAKKDYKKQIKILLLGPGESGKSTIFKQMKIIQDGGGFSEEELVRFKSYIYTNCISQMRCIVSALIELQIPFRNRDNAPHADAILHHSGIDWSTSLGNTIKVLWSDPSIQEVFKKHGSRYQLNDTAKYFFENIERINEPNYIPTEDDVLRVRVKSSGIEEALFSFDNKLYRVVDVGGQRSERRKWMHCFDGVTAVLFCASLAEYDLPLREDPRVNRLLEATRVFSEVTNQEIFAEKAIIFFLNKTDLLREKLALVALELHQPEYLPPEADINTDVGLEDHFNSASDYIKKLFISEINKTKRSLDTLYVHYTCALDTENVEVVITAVRSRLLNVIIDEIGY